LKTFFKTYKQYNIYCLKILKKTSPISVYTNNKMAKKTSSAASATTTAPAPAPAPAPVQATATKPAKAPKTPKTDAPVAPAPVQVASTDAHTEGSAIEASSLGSLFSEFGSKLQTLSSGLSTLRSDFRTLERHVAREMRAAQKISKRKRKSGNRAPSGFVKPTLISKELANFLGKPVGTEWARTEVTREINAYIRTHSLQDKENGRKINPDTKLRALLQLKKDEELTYFNLQKYMSPHFAKATPAVVASVN
jgi:upstream activation factor subunit UAF30